MNAATPTTPKPRAYSYVRMSTPGQLHGDSLRRQTLLSEQYAEEHGLELDKELKLHDIGVSAFDGSNLERGELGAFLAAVESGKVAKGSMLLIESFDRLSRGDLQSSITLLMRLLNSGITIVTLSDRQKFVPGDTKPESLLMSVVVLSRAHDESAQKSRRLKAVWENKRKNADQEKLTGRCPGWMHLSKCKTDFILIPERVDIVRRIFNESIDGIGADAIARRLNREGVPTFRNSKGRQKSTIQKILSNRAVLGVFQPGKVVDGARIPTGSEIKGYFPAIIDEEQFFAAQGAIAARFTRGGGRKGEKVSNLFSKVAICGYCQHRMHYINKGARGGQFLVCDYARRGLGCWKIPWNYRDFETSFLSFVNELNLGAIIEPSQKESKINSIKDKLLSVNGRLLEARRQCNILLDLILESGNPDVSLKGRMHKLDDEIASLSSQKKELERSELELVSQHREFQNSRQSLQLAIKALQDPSSDDIYKLRMDVSQKITALLTNVSLYPGGGHLSTQSTIDTKIDFMVKAGFEYGSVKTFFQNPPPADYKKHRSFCVMFRDKSTRLVRQDPEKPSSCVYQFTSEEGFKLGDSPYVAAPTYSNLIKSTRH